MEMGPLTSLHHQRRVLEYVDIARREGAEVISGGVQPSNSALALGCYVEPTVIKVSSQQDRLIQEEVFGPFVTVQTFRNEAEALAPANGTQYCLGSGLWTRDLQRAHSLASDLKAGIVWINSYKRANPGSPFGGVGRSGYGREMGFDAMQEYTQAKSIWVNVNAQIPAYYRR